MLQGVSRPKRTVSIEQYQTLADERAALVRQVSQLQADLHNFKATSDQAAAAAVAAAREQFRAEKFVDVFDEVNETIAEQMNAGWGEKWDAREAEMQADREAWEEQLNADWSERWDAREAELQAEAAAARAAAAAAEAQVAALREQLAAAADAGARRARAAAPPAEVRAAAEAEAAMAA